MAILEIVMYPDPRLKKVSETVKANEIKKLQPFMDDMLETMYASKGLGLAAVQVGVRRVAQTVQGRVDVADGPGECHPRIRAAVPRREGQTARAIQRQRSRHHIQ